MNQRSHPGTLLLSLALMSLPLPAQDLLLVANKTDRTLGIIDINAGKQIAALPEDGVTGHEVAASPDGRLAFVPIFGSGGVGTSGTDGEIIRVFDVREQKRVGTVEFGKGVRPHEAIFGPADGLLYVTTELDNSVSIIDPKTFKVVGRIPTGHAESHMLAITRDGRLGYTSNVGPGTISVLDLIKRERVGTISLGGRAQRISLSADDKLVFTANQQKPELIVVDTAKREISRRAALPSSAYGTAATADGKWLLLALPRSSKVAVMSLADFTVTRTLDVPRAPQEILIRPDGKRAYASCDSSGKIAEIDLEEWKVSRLIDAGAGADGLAWAAQPKDRAQARER